MWHLGKINSLLRGVFRKLSNIHDGSNIHGFFAELVNGFWLRQVPKYVSNFVVFTGFFWAHPVYWSQHLHVSQANIYLLKFNNSNTRKRYETCWKLTIKTPERCQWLLVWTYFTPLSRVSIVDFEQINFSLDRCIQNSVKYLRCNVLRKWLAVFNR